MQGRQGYCSSCRVPYPNLEQHLFSAQHRSMIRVSRNQLNTTSLMDRFLQDVLRHHPNYYQENRSVQRVNPASASEVIPLDNSVSEEQDGDGAETEEDTRAKSFEPTEALHSIPSISQQCTEEVPVRPSVIQKLEKGQQQPLEIFYKIGTGMKTCNSIDIGQATNNGNNLTRPPVIFNAPPSRLPESSYDSPVKTNMTGLPPAAHLDSVNKCDPNKVDLEPDRVSRKPTVSFNLETSSVSYQKPKESNSESLGINSDKLVLQKDVKSQGKILSAGSKFREPVDTEGPLRVDSPHELEVNSAVNVNNTDMPSNKEICEDAIPKYHEGFFPNVVYTQEEKHLVANKSAFLKQKCLGSSELKFDCSSLQSASPQPQEATRDLSLWNETDQEDNNCESRDSETSSDCGSSFHSLTDQSKVTAKEINHSEEVDADLQYNNNNKFNGSEISSDCDDSLQLVTNQSSVIVKEISLQNTTHISLVDQSYESSSSEVNFDCDASLQSTNGHPQQPVKEVNRSKEEHIGLIDKNCGSSSSEVSADSVFPPQSVVDQPPVAVREIKLRRKVHTGLVDDCACSSSNLTLESDPAPLSAAERARLGIGRNKERIYLRDESRGSTSSNLTFESVVDQPYMAVYEEEPVAVESKNNESYVSEIPFDFDVPLYSENDQLEYEDSERENDEPCGSEISSVSYTPPHSVTNSPEVAVNEVIIQNEEYEDSERENDEPLAINEVIIQSEEYEDSERENDEPCGSEISSVSYTSPHSVTNSPEVAVNENEEYEHLERENDEPSDSEVSSDSYTPLHSVTNSPEVAVKEFNPQQEDQVYLENKENEPTDSELSFNYDIIFHSMTGHSEDPIEEINLQKEEHIDSENKGKSAEFSGSETNSDPGVSHCSLAEPQAATKNITRKKQHVPENEDDKCSGSEIIQDSDVASQSEKPQEAVLKEDHNDPEDESTEQRSFEVNLDVNVPLHSVTDQPQLAPLQESHVDQEDKNSESSGSRITFDSSQLQDVAVLKLKIEEYRAAKLKNNSDDAGRPAADGPAADGPAANRPSAANRPEVAVNNSDGSVQPVVDQLEVAVKPINLGNEEHIYFDIKNFQESCSQMHLDSDFLVQPIVDGPQVTLLEQEHIELGGKHSQSCGSEISFDSDDPLQSVADQLRETVREISLWKDEEVDMEDKRHEARSFGIVYGSDVLQSMAGQTEGVKKLNLWREHVGLESEIVKPGNSKANFDSDKPLQSVTNEIQRATKESLLRDERRVYLDNKSYEPHDSEIIYVSNIPFQSVIKRPQILEEMHPNLEDKNIDPCAPEVSFDSSNPFQSGTTQVQKAVREINLWKEDHIYLEDNSYRLGGFEVNCDSVIPVHFVPDQSPVSGKEINLQKKYHNDLENKNCEFFASEIQCGSGIHFQSEVCQPQVACKEINFQQEKHLGMEEKTGEPSDSEMCDSVGPFEIVVNQYPPSVKETDLPKVVLVDVVPGDGDCDVISHPDIPFELVTDPPQMAVSEIDCIHAECIHEEEESCDSFGPEVRCVCQDLPPSVASESEETFKIINRKRDYIILGNSNNQSCGSEVTINVDASDQLMTYQSEEPDQKMVNYVDPGNKRRKSNRPKATSRPVTRRRQKARKKVSLRKDGKDLRNTGPKGKSCKSSVSAKDFDASSESVVHQMPAKETRLQSKRRQLESMSCEPGRSEINLQCDRSLQSDTDQPQEAVNKTDLFKKVSSNLEEKNHDPQSSSVPMVDSVKSLEKAKEVVEDNADEPVLEALPHVPPSFVGKTWSQIMREDDIKINTLVKEFREGRFHCYFDDDSKTKKVSSTKKKKRVTWADLQDNASTQAPSDCNDTASSVSKIVDSSVASDKPCHPPPPRPPEQERPPEHERHVPSPCQPVKVSHGTQTNFVNFPIRKRKQSRQEEGSPKSKRLHSQVNRKAKKKVKCGTVNFPESSTTVLRPMQSKALFYVLSSLNIKLQEGECLHFSKKSWDNDIQFICKYKRNNYDSWFKDTVANPPLNIVVPEFDNQNWVKINVNKNNGNSSAGDNDANGQSSSSAPSMTMPARSRLSSQNRSDDSSLKDSEAPNASEVPKGDNFQLLILKRDIANTSPKSIRKESSGSKSKKLQRRKVTTANKPDFPKKVLKPIILQQKTEIASEKQSNWMQTKPSDIIRKYISKYSVFLRRRYQSRSTSIGMDLKKKKSVVSTLKNVKRPAKIFLNSSVPPAGAEEPSSTISSLSLKHPVRGFCHVNGNTARKRKYGNKKYNSKKESSSEHVKPYSLRSLSRPSSHAKRMNTRLSNKLRGSERK
uniref:Zinc finger DBF-type containing 2 n=1 Tax=Microcebus murinus TaxID=30608 RepID=A0A8C5YC55_MICMU